MADRHARREASFSNSGKTLAIVVATALAGPAAAYSLIGSTWDLDKGPVKFVIDPAGSDDIDDDSDVEAVRAAFRIWSCAEGSRFRFQEEPDLEIIKNDDLTNGSPVVFWDETNEFALGPATLGVCYGDGQPGGTRTAAKIIFNGFDSTWSTDDSASAVDVGSIAIHEIGHWLGLDHSELPASEAVMAPTYPGGILRFPFDDDLAGLLEMYPQDPDDESTCDGPFGKGEYCACDDDCANDLRCLPQPDDSTRCAALCTSDDPDACGAGFNCILAEKPTEDAPAPGLCEIVVPGTAKPAGAICQNDGFSCGPTTDCVTSGAAGGERVCFHGCQEDADCEDGYQCAGILCLLSPERIGIPCPEPEPEDEPEPSADTADETTDGCGCAAAPATGAPWFALAVTALLAAAVRRRSSTSASSRARR